MDANVRAIVCSGYSTDPAVVDWSKHGFSGAIGKPFRAEDLVAVINTVVGPQD
jgi:DNA-binding NarL/FixJ family response regulator